jgi:hypothetical protein
VRVTIILVRIGGKRHPVADEPAPPRDGTVNMRPTIELPTGNRL